MLGTEGAETTGSVNCGRPSVGPFGLCAISSMVDVMEDGRRASSQLTMCAVEYLLVMTDGGEVTLGTLRYVQVP